MRSLFWSLALICLSGHSYAAEHGVILLYHHVSDSTPAITSIGPDQFEQHLDYLQENDLAVVALSRILDAASNSDSDFRNDPLPDRAIAISFDDAYESVYSSAYPLLKEYDWPFSVFVSTEAIDQGYGGYMNWDQLREVQNYGAEIGGHSVSHAHLIRTLEGENHAQWLARVSAEIDEGNARIEEEIGVPVRLFAYPYGEFNRDLKGLLADRGLYGLAQNSGAVGSATDVLEVPRYPMAQSFARMERFALVARSKALPAIEIDSGSSVRTEGEESGLLRFSLLVGDYQINNLACYSSTGTSLPMEVTDYSVSIGLPDFVPGRNKVNCTAPSSSEPGAYYWFSQQWLVKSANGEWPSE